jgi:antitoxin VapB
MYLFEESSMKTAKIFKHGNSQAVRLPKEFRFAGNQVQIKRAGAGVLLLPGKLTFEQIMAAVGQFKSTIKRQQPKDQGRQWQ